MPDQSLKSEFAAFKSEYEKKPTRRDQLRSEFDAFRSRLSEDPEPIVEPAPPPPAPEQPGRIRSFFGGLGDMLRPSTPPDRPSRSVPPISFGSPPQQFLVMDEGSGQIAPLTKPPVTPSGVPEATRTGRTMFDAPMTVPRVNWNTDDLPPYVPDSYEQAAEAAQIKLNSGAALSDDERDAIAITKRRRLILDARHNVRLGIDPTPEQIEAFEIESLREKVKPEHFKQLMATRHEAVEPTFAEKEAHAIGSFERGVTSGIAGVPKAMGLIDYGVGKLIPGYDGPASPEETDFYRFGQAIEGAAEKHLLPIPDERQRGSFWTETLPQGAGSMASFLVGGAAGKAAKIPAALIPSIIGALEESASVYDEARAMGKPVNDSLKAAGWGGVAGTLEGIPVARALERLNQVGGKSFFAHVLREGAKGAVEEGVQEGVQSGIEDVALGRQRSEVPEGAAAGAILGGATSLITGGIGHMRGRRMARQQEEADGFRNALLAGLPVQAAPSVSPQSGQRVRYVPSNLPADVQADEWRRAGHGEPAVNEDVIEGRLFEYRTPRGSEGGRRRQMAVHDDDGRVHILPDGASVRQIGSQGETDALDTSPGRRLETSLRPITPRAGSYLPPDFTDRLHADLSARAASGLSDQQLHDQLTEIQPVPSDQPLPAPESVSLPPLNATREQVIRSAIDNERSSPTGRGVPNIIQPLPAFYRGILSQIQRTPANEYGIREVELTRSGKVAGELQRYYEDLGFAAEVTTLDNGRHMIHVTESPVAPARPTAANLAPTPPAAGNTAAGATGAMNPRQRMRQLEGVLRDIDTLARQAESEGIEPTVLLQKRQMVVDEINRLRNPAPAERPTDVPRPNLSRGPEERLHEDARRTAQAEGQGQRPQGDVLAASEPLEDTAGAAAEAAPGVRYPKRRSEDFYRFDFDSKTFEKVAGAAPVELGGGLDAFAFDDSERGYGWAVHEARTGARISDWKPSKKLAVEAAKEQVAKRSTDEAVGAIEAAVKRQGESPRYAGATGPKSAEVAGPAVNAKGEEPSSKPPATASQTKGRTGSQQAVIREIAPSDRTVPIDQLRKQIGWKPLQSAPGWSIRESGSGTAKEHAYQLIHDSEDRFVSITHADKIKARDAALKYAANQPSIPKTRPTPAKSFDDMSAEEIEAAMAASIEKELGEKPAPTKPNPAPLRSQPFTVMGMPGRFSISAAKGGTMNRHDSSGPREPVAYRNAQGKWESSTGALAMKQSLLDTHQDRLESIYQQVLKDSGQGEPATPKEGDAVYVFGVPSTLMNVETHDGVSYELYAPQRPGGKATVRVQDESGSNVSMTQYNSLAEASAEWTKAINIAREARPIETSQAKEAESARAIKPAGAKRGPIQRISSPESGKLHGARETVKKKIVEIDDELRGLAGEIADYFKDKLPSNTPLDPALVKLTAKMLTALTKRGVLKFADAVLAIAQIAPDQVGHMGKAIEAGWRYLRTINPKLDAVGDAEAIIQGHEADRTSNLVGRTEPPGGAVANAAGGSSQEGDASGPSGPKGESVAQRPGEATQEESADEQRGEQGGDARIDDRPDESELRPRKPDSTQPGGREGPRGISSEREARADDANHIIEADDVIAPRGEIAQLKANIEAIRLVKALQAEGRNATSTEKRSLAKFSGWGNLSQAFDELKGEAMLKKEQAPNISSYYYDENWSKKWGPYYKQLKEILTQEEFEAARASTLNAHYTSRTVITAMWDMAKRLGFRGGTVLEPAAGIGHFFGLMPADASARSKLIGVELDQMTGRMLEKLYPQANISVAGFEDVRIPNNSVDLAISNVPFDASGPIDAERRYDKTLNLHNYFIARMLDAVKPGGIVLAITTHHTMDSAIDQRKLLASKAELVAAIRLPNTAFKENAGTEVTTDILILRKPDGGPAPVRNAWEGVASIDTDTKDVQATVNEYFSAHPEQMLGTPSMEGKMYGRQGDKREFTLKPTPGAELDEQIRAAMDALPPNIMGVQSPTDAPMVEIDRGDTAGAREGTIRYEDQKNATVYQDGKWVPIEEVEPELRGAAAAKMVSAFVGLRDHYQVHIQKMLSEEASDADVEASRRKLNDLYDALVHRYGYINTGRMKLLEFDPGYYLLASLEQEAVSFDDKGRRRTTFSKADVFTKRTISPRNPPSRVDTLSDAISVSLAYRARIVPEYLASLLGKELAAVEQELSDSGEVFEDPQKGTWETQEQYLSGNVRAKLREAELAAEDNPKFTRNVEALKKVQPDRIAFSGIGLRLGGTWLPAKVVQGFARDALGSPAASVTYVHAADRWIGRDFRNDATANADKYGTSRRLGHEILLNVLNLQSPKVYDNVTDSEGNKKSVFNEVETAAAQAKALSLQQAFQQWVRGNPEAQKLIEDAYNHHFNFYVRPKFDGSRLILPGATDSIRLRPHQSAMVWRGLQERRGMIAHAVGAGKTYTAIALTMESRRLGLMRKPMIVVQNATLGQFAASFRRMYPLANVLVATKDDLKKEKRKRFLTRIVSGDYDGIVISQSQFALLPVKLERLKQAIDNEITTLMDLIAEERERSGKNSPTVKQLEKQRRALQRKLEKLIERAVAQSTENVVFFDDLGIDGLILDEAHAYKKPMFVTKLDNLVGIQKSASAVAINTKLKAESVQERNDGRGVFAMTGTPITNTLGEAWHHIRMVAPDVLEEFGVTTFDQFISTFAEIAPTLEMNAGGKWVQKTAVTKFTNGPEMQNLLHASWDVVAGDRLREILKEQKVDLPEIRGGGAQIVNIPRSNAVADFMAYLGKVYDQFRDLTGKEKRRWSHIPLLTYMAGRAAALDMRLIFPDAKDDPKSKINHVVGRVKEIYDRETAMKGAQLVFIDRANPVRLDSLQSFMGGDAHDTNIIDEDDAETDDGGAESQYTDLFLYRDIVAKLVRQGIPESEIAVINDYDTDVKRDTLFAKVNEGKIRVLIGGTQKMGVGVNVQERLAAIHHVDAPWMPADLEQREGRIVRQGNLYRVVDIFSYGVEKTLDAAIYSKLLRKAKFIQQAISGNFVGREFEDPSGPVVLSYSEQVAALSGDPRVIQLMELETAVRNLAFERDAHESHRASQRDELLFLKKNNERARTLSIPKLQRILASIQSAGVKPGEWSADIEGKTYRDRDAIAEKLDNIIKDRAARNYEKSKKEELRSIQHGERLHDESHRILTTTINGFTVKVFAGAYMAIDRKIGSSGLIKSFEPAVHATIEIGESGNLYHGSARTGPGLLGAIAEVPERIRRDIQTEESEIARQEQRIKDLQESMSQGWEKEAEFENATKLRDAIKSELAAEGESKKKDDTKADDVAGSPAGVPANIPRQLAPKGKGGIKPDVTVDQIIKHLEKITGSPIRSGHGKFAQRKAAGWFSQRTGEIRLQQHRHLQFAAHEAGHSLHDKLLNWQISGIPKQARKELLKLGHDLYGSRKPVAGYLREGIAEYVAKRLLGDDVRTEVPAAHDWFNATALSKPEALADFQEAERLYKAWDEQGAMARAAAQIVSVQPGFLHRAKTAFAKLQKTFSARMWTNDASILERMTRDLIQQGGRAAAIRPDQDPAKLRAALKMNAPGTARYMIQESMVNAAGVKTGKSLSDVLQPVKHDMERFTIYAYAKRAVLLWSRNINPGISRADATYIVKRLETVPFQRAVEGITTWTNGLMDYVVSAGGLSPEAARAIRNLNPIYLPLKRYFDETYKGISQGRTGRGEVDIVQALHKIKGSSRPIIDPMESLARYAEFMVSLGNKIRVGRAIADLADSIPKSSWYASKVDLNKVPTTFTLESIASQLEAIGVEVESGDLDQILTVFSNAQRYSGKDNIVAIWRNGKREFWELHPDLYEAVTGMDKEHLPAFLRDVLGWGKRLVQLGAVGLSPSFGLVKNPLRDAMTWFVYTRSGALLPTSSLRGLWAELSRDDAAKRFRAAGLEMTTLMGQDRHAATRVLAESLARTKTEKVVMTARHPIDAARKLNGFFESSPRIAEFKAILAKAEQKYGKDSLAAAIEASLAAKEVTLNFTRQGIMGSVLNGMIAFFNPNIQDISKFYRTFTGKEGTGVALKATARVFAGITLPSLLLWWWNKDEEWYQDRPEWERQAFWLMSPNDGGFIVRIPKPFLLGYVFGSLPEAIVNYAYRNDPAAREYLSDTFFETFKTSLPVTTPYDLLPSAIRPAIEVASNYDAFRSRQIDTLSEQMNELPAERYNAWTTETAKVLGDRLGVSPKRVDHFLKAQTGGLALEAIRRGEALAGVRKLSDLELPDMPVVGPLFAREGQSNTIERFYDRLLELQKLESAKRLTEDSRRELNALRHIHMKGTALRHQIKTAPAAERTALQRRLNSAMKEDIQRQRLLR